MVNGVLWHEEVKSGFVRMGQQTCLPLVGVSGPCRCGEHVQRLGIEHVHTRTHTHTHMHAHAHAHAHTHTRMHACMHAHTVYPFPEHGTTGSQLYQLDEGKLRSMGVMSLSLRQRILQETAELLGLSKEALIQGNLTASSSFGRVCVWRGRIRVCEVGGWVGMLWGG